jgi:hypothetical protein
MLNSKFGMLTVIEFLHRSKFHDAVYKCKCDCGNEVNVLSGNLKKGNSTSCGCKRLKTCSIRMSKLNLKHGETKTKLWRTWKGIIERTTSKNSSHYFRYGGKGIGIYKEWLDYKKFAEYIGQPPSDKHTIDRIDNSKGYEPGNVRWATAKEQAANRCTNVFVIINNKKMISSEAAKILNVSQSTIGRWIKSGKLNAVT